MRTVGYYRISTQKQLKEKTHELQIDKINRFAEYHNHDLLKVFGDKAVSGQRDQKDEWEKMKNFIINPNNKVELVVATKISRISRSMRNFMNIVDWFQKLNLQFVLIDQNLNLLDNSPTSRLLRNTLGIFAEFETDMIIERTQGGRERAEERGVITHRPKLDLPVKEIKKEFLEGASIKFLANKHKVSWHTINNRLKELGLK